MAVHAALRRQSGFHVAGAMHCASTPQKPQPGAAAALEGILPQQWRRPAAMVLATAALLLCAPSLWARSASLPLVPIVVSRRHLQQPSIELLSPGAGTNAPRMSQREQTFADRHDRQHVNDPPPERQVMPPYLPPDDKFQPPVARATAWEKLASGARRRLRRHPEGYVALCLAVKDQAQDMTEWLEWHQLLGVSRMYVFDMGSSPPMNQMLRPYIESGLVEYHWVKKSALPARGEVGKMPPQLAIYDICINEFKHRHAWMGFFDADEFLVMRDRSLRLPAFLKAYEQHGGLAVNWDTFGSSGYANRPTGSSIKSYWRCVNHDTPSARHTKTLVNLRFSNRPYKDPHTFTYTHGRRAVNERFAFVDAPVHAYHTSEQIVLHHYVSKSLQENQEKMARGSAMLNSKKQAFFDNINKEATQECWDGVHAARELGFWPDKPAAYPQLNVKTDAELKALPAAAGGPPAQPLPASSPLPPLPAETGTDAAQAPAVGTETEVETHVQQAAEAKADATTQTQPAAGPAAAQDLAGDITADSSMAGIEALISTLSSAAGTAVVAGSSSDGPVSPDRKAPETREDSTER